MDTQTTAPHSPADRAHVVGQDAKEATRAVASTAAQEAGRTTREAKDQARQLWSQTRSEMTEQASTQQARAATGLRDIAEQLEAMAGGSDQDGMARSLVEDVARRAGEAASWLDQRDPGTLLHEVRDVARRRPGTFLAVAAGLGVVAGRLSRGLVADSAQTAPTTGADSRATTTGTTTGTTTETGAVAGSPVASPAMGDEPRGGGLGTDAVPPRLTQPMMPDGTPTPIDDEGRLGAPEMPYRGPR